MRAVGIDTDIDYETTVIWSDVSKLRSWLERCRWGQWALTLTLTTKQQWSDLMLANSGPDYRDVDDPSHDIAVKPATTLKRSQPHSDAVHSARSLVQYSCCPGWHGKPCLNCLFILKAYSSNAYCIQTELLLSMKRVDFALLCCDSSVVWPRKTVMWWMTGKLHALHWQYKCQVILFFWYFCMSEI